jgi:CheY-like chemotaxis protein
MDRIDIILLDMIMPVIGGGETFDAIKKINPKARVLLSSGYSLDGEASEILGRGCDGFIQKPFDINHLSQKLRKILDAPKADSGCHFSRQSDTDKPRDKPLTL